MMQNRIKYIIMVLAFINLNVYGQKKVNDFDENGKTPLVNAISSKDLTKVKQLVDKNADVNLKEQKGLRGTPLMYATSTGNLNMCKYLIENGANVNLLDANKDHALNWATYYGHVNIMNLLIKNSTDLTINSKHGTAVDVVLRLWHHDSVDQVFRTTNIARELTKNELEFIKSLKNENYKKLQKLIKRGVSPDLKDEINSPMLQLAAQSGNFKMVEFLVDSGADVNCINRVGQTPLAWASRFGHKNVVEYLIKSGANTNLTDKKHQLTPLIGAAIGNHSFVGREEA